MNKLLNHSNGKAGDIVALLKSKLIADVLPLWSSEGRDLKSGSFVERLDCDGKPDLVAPRRVRVQARQIYCFAKAAQMAGDVGRPIATVAQARALLGLPRRVSG